MSPFFRIFQHLLPDSMALRIRKAATAWQYGDGSQWGQAGLLWGSSAAGRDIDRLFQGLASGYDATRQFVDAVWLDQYPASTRAIDEYEDQFGLTTAALEADRRANVDAAWKATGGQSPSYLQGVVQAAGFDLYIHDPWSGGPAPYTVRDPRDHTNIPTVGTVQAGEPLAQAGEPTALANNLLANQVHYLVNGNLTPSAPPVIPADSTAWPHFLYWGAATFPDRAQIATTRREELERLLLKICPSEKWIVTLIDYV